MVTTTTTKHTSTDLEELNEKIAKLLKDPTEAIEQASINFDAMSLPELRVFAERGGLGACVSKADVLANSPDELMYLQGERITVLRHIEDDTYMGYCEGVIGSFNAESVHFVELDPRVLESLDADMDITDNSQYRNSTSSYGASDVYPVRSSLQSFSSNSEQYNHPYHYHQQPAQTTHLSLPSIESVNTNSSYVSHLQNSRISSLSDESRAQQSRIHHGPYDTSVFNTDYSDGEGSELDRNAATTLPHTLPSTSSKKKTIKPLPSMPNYNNSNTKRSETHKTKYTTTTTNHDADGDTSDEDHSSSQGQVDAVYKHNSLGNVSFDEYGFVIDPNRTKTLNNATSLIGSMKSIKEYRENELKWLSIVSKLDAGTVKKDAKMKKMVRMGIPASVRARVWQFLAGSHGYHKPGQFETLMAKPRKKIYTVIERDIGRCYPNHTQFMEKEGQGQQDLGNVLKAYAQYNPDLEYCQGMGRLAGLMLMQMTVEDTFWLLVATIDRYMNGYFTPELPQLRIDAYIIGQLLKDHQPKLAQHLEDNDVLPIMYIAQWFLTSFTMTLPWESVLRVWDAFYFEGIKVFYRVSLAIMEICKDHLLQSCPTSEQLLDFLLHIPHHYLESSALLEIAFRINLSKTDIKKYAIRAGSEDATTSGLSFEHGIKNLQASSSNSSINNYSNTNTNHSGLSLSFKSFKGKKPKNLSLS